ncbi:MAG: hypothetical protein ACT6U0_12290 [Shinella sp.]|uniref:hypothetical protein n=1 Tax=Shinella sp. TaxID=1870904 RepID=UPI004035E1DC
MTTIDISPAVIQQESNDMLKYLKDRNLLLAQVVHDLRLDLASAEAQIAALKEAATATASADILVDQIGGA